MNPFEIAGIAVSAGCGAGAARFCNLLRLAQDALPAGARHAEPVNELEAAREDWDSEWLTETGKALAKGPGDWEADTAVEEVPAQ